MPDVGPVSDQPYIVWALGAALLAAGGFVKYLFGVIRSNREDSKAVAEAVRQELFRAQAQWDAKLEIMRVTAAERWQEGREDRKALQDQVQEYHRTDLEQHESMIASIANLPMVITALLREQRRGS